MFYPFQSGLYAALIISISGGALAAHGPTTASKAVPAPETTNTATINGLPSVDMNRMGSIDLSRLPVGPDGNRIVATVNGKPITERRLLTELKTLLGTKLVKGPRLSGPAVALAAPALDSLIKNSIYQEYAISYGIGVTFDEVTRELEAANRLRGAGRRVEDEAFSQGLSADELKMRTSETLLATKVKLHVQDRLATGTPTPQQLREYVASRNQPTSSVPEIRAAHIVFRATPDMSAQAVEDARQRAERTLGLIKNGLNFEQAARQYSQDRNTAARGGDLGYFTRGKMYPEFDAAAFSLQPGQVSGAVRTPVGYHIIKVFERHNDNLRSMFMAHQRSKAFAEWLDNTMKAASIERLL